MAKLLFYASGIALIAVAALTFSLAARYLGRLADLIALSVSSLPPATTTIFFEPGDSTLASGATTSIDVDINTNTAINALGATVVFPTSTIAVTGIDTQKSFINLWIENATTSGTPGQMHFSGGTTQRGGFTGAGTVLTLTVQGVGAGTSTLDFKNVQVYPSDASGKNIDTQLRPLTLTVAPAPPPAVVAAAGGAGGAEAVRIVPSGDFNGDGKVDLTDLSIFIAHSIGAYDARYDLNGDGVVGLTDLAILLARMSGH